MKSAMLFLFLLANLFCYDHLAIVPTFVPEFVMAHAFLPLSASIAASAARQVLFGDRTNWDSLPVSHPKEVWDARNFHLGHNG